MPVKFEKKDVPVTMKLAGSVRVAIEEIAGIEDRPLGYVARELMIRGLGLYRIDGKLRDDKATTFDLDKTLAETDDPHGIINQWFAAEGFKVPRDMGLIFFNGWETFSDDQKRDALTDAKRVLERTLKGQQRRAPVIARIEPGKKTQDQRAEIQKSLDNVMAIPKKRKAR